MAEDEINENLEGAEDPIENSSDDLTPTEDTIVPVGG